MEKHLGRKIVVLSHIIRRNIDHCTEKSGLSGPQSRILHFIADHSAAEDVFQRDLENVFRIRRSSITSLVQSLERSGLIERVSVESDARLKKLVITKKGWEVQKEIGKRIDDFEKQLDDLLGEDQELISRKLDELIDTLNDC